MAAPPLRLLSLGTIQVRLLTSWSSVGLETSAATGTRFWPDGVVPMTRPLGQWSIHPDPAVRLQHFSVGPQSLTTSSSNQLVDHTIPSLASQGPARFKA